jgi:hypothetical protein
MKLWPFRKEARELSEELRGALFTMFGIGSKDAESMLYVDKRDRLGGQRISRVCVFDPASLTVPELAAISYDNLMNLNKGLLFTGHVFEGANSRREGTIALDDRRAA